MKTVGNISAIVPQLYFYSSFSTSRQSHPYLLRELGHVIGRPSLQVLSVESGVRVSQHFLQYRQIRGVTCFQVRMQ